MTQKHIKTKLTAWRKTHPDCNWDTFWFVQNAIGTLLGWPEWYSEWIMEMGYNVKTNGK